MRRNIVLYVVTFFVVFAVDFGLNSYFSYRLNVENYLFYQNLINIIPFSIALLSLGTPFGIVYLTSLTKDKPVIYLQESNQLVLMLSVASVIIVSLLFVYGVVNLYVVTAFSLAFFSAIKQNIVAYFLSKKDLVATSFIRLNQKLIYGLIAIFLVNLFVLNFGILSVVLVAGELVGFVILQIKYKVIKLKKFRKLKSILKISKYSFFCNAASMLTVSLPLLLLNYNDYSHSDILSFAVAFSLLRYSGLILGPFMQLITPYFTPIKQDVRLVKALFVKFLPVMVIVACLVPIGAYYFTEPLINIFFDAKYHHAILLFKILLLSIPFMFLNSYLVIVISSVQSIKVTFRIVVASFIFLLLCLSFTTKYNYPLTTVCYVIVIGYALDFILSAIVLNRYIVKSGYALDT